MLKTELFIKNNNLKASGTILAAFLASSLVAGCGLKDAVGMSKKAPDEFAIMTKAPLVIPPDYGLRPPRAGASGPSTSSTEAARSSVFGSQRPDPAVGTSPGELALLRQAGALNADSTIRDQLSREAGGAPEVYEDDEPEDKGFLNKLIFWGKDDDGPDE